MRDDVKIIFDHFNTLYGGVNSSGKFNVKQQISDRRKIVENYGSVNGNHPVIDEKIIIKKVKVHGIPCEWIIDPDADPNKRLLYIHGGAFFAGSLDSHRAMSCEISKKAGVAVLAVDYRLAPENPFPAGLDDCFEAYEWLLENSINGRSKASSIFIAGDSAGGNLAISLLLKLKYTTLRMPNAVLPISPVLDFTFKSKSIHELADKDPVINKKGLLKGLPLVYLFGKDILKIDKGNINKVAVLTKVILNKNKYVKNPLVSPIYGDLTGLPPILINVGASEILRDDSIRFVEKARSQCVNANVKIWDDMMHVFIAFMGHIPEAEQCLDEMANFIKANN